MNATLQDRPLRILLAGYRSHPHVGGQGIYIKHLSAALARLGHEVTVISGPPYPELEDGIRCIQLPSMNLYEHPTPFKALTPSHWSSLANWIEWWGKITGKFTEPEAFGRRLARFLKQDFIKHGQRFDIVHDNQCLADQLLKLPLPVTTTIHHPITRDFEAALAEAPTVLARYGAKRWYGFLGMQSRVARKIAGVVTVSESSRRDIEACFGRQAARTHVIFNGLDTDLFSPAAHNTTAEQPTLLTTSSSDQPVKGFGVLLKAYAEILKHEPSVKLKVIGKLNKKSPHHKTINELGLSGKITFESGLSDEQMRDAYRSATIYICPSRYEGFGLPVAEAMSCGTPVITSNGGALPEVVADAGIVVPAGNAPVLVEQTIKLLRDDALRAELSRKGRNRALEQFCWQKVASQYVAHYKTVIPDFHAAKTVRTAPLQVSHGNR